MTARLCKECDRRIYQPELAKCPSCGGELSGPTKPARKINRSQFRERQAFCHGCENFGDFRSDVDGIVRKGCGLLEKPCHVEQLWLQNGREWCPAKRPYSKPGTPAWQTVDEFVVVTSLRVEDCPRQQRALTSWREFGCQIIAVQDDHEIRPLGEVYPQVDLWSACDDTIGGYQKVVNLCRSAIEFGQPIMLINSDVEMYGRKEPLVSLMRPDRLVIGVRHNYSEGQYAMAKQEPWGLDAFIITSEMAETLPDVRLEFGRPVWDYYLPLELRKSGFAIEILEHPLFFHEQHARRWSDRDWKFREAIASEELGMRVTRQIRRSLD